MLWQRSSLQACTWRRAAMRRPVSSAVLELRRQEMHAAGNVSKALRHPKRCATWHCRRSPCEWLLQKGRCAATCRDACDVEWHWAALCIAQLIERQPICSAGSLYTSARLMALHERSRPQELRRLHMSAAPASSLLGSLHRAKLKHLSNKAHSPGDKARRTVRHGAVAWLTWRQAVSHSPTRRLVQK